MLLTILGFIVGILYLAVNIWTAVAFDPRQMKARFVDGQCTVGLISAAIFYAPAWFLKVFKKAVNKVIK